MRITQAESYQDSAAGNTGREATPARRRRTMAGGNRTRILATLWQTRCEFSAVSPGADQPA
jgi:hypothetical protein